MSDFLLVFIIVVLLFGVFRRYILFLVMAGVSRLLFRQFQKMQERAMEQQSRYSNPSASQGRASSAPGNKPSQGEYVDYEEVKD